MEKCETKEILDEKKIDNVELNTLNNINYYVIKGRYNGDFDYQNIDFSDYNEEYDVVEEKINAFNMTSILDYYQYESFCDKWELNKKYKDENKKYMIISYASYGSSIVDAEIANVIEEKGKITVYLRENVKGVTADINGYFIAIPINNSTYQSEIVTMYNEEEYNNIVKYGTTYNPNEMVVYKPVIYIYPEEEMNVEVKLPNSSFLTVSYPKYENSWNVIASPDGNLYDLDTNRNYYSLYYEASNHKATMENDGFIVKDSDVVKFLEEKLDILGLNEREIDEFIIYWLPKLECNKYNYIRFETKEEIDSYMPLIITPNPDSVIRVIMDYKPLDEVINVMEQELELQKRSGYSVIEWGGSLIK